jgi:hypothetical protein
MYLHAPGAGSGQLHALAAECPGEPKDTSGTLQRRETFGMYRESKSGRPLRSLVSHSQVYPGCLKKTCSSQIVCCYSGFKVSSHRCFMLTQKVSMSLPNSHSVNVNKLQFAVMKL